MKELPFIDIKSPAEVLIIGNLNIDLIIRKVPHIPVWGQEVLGTDYEIFSSGQSAYTAFALARLGVKSKIVSCVGNDDYGQNILNDLHTACIDTSTVKFIKNGRTGITVAIVREDGERAFVSDPGSLKDFNLLMAMEGLDSSQTLSVTCILGSFFMPGFSLKDVGICLKKAKERGSTTLLDTGWDSEGWKPETIKHLRDNLSFVDYFIPNLDEACALTEEKSPEKAAIRLTNDGCPTVIIKLGSEGSYLLSGKTEYHIPAFSTDVHDAVGAGDVFNAGFIVGTLNRWPLDARMIFGSAVSSLYISRQTDRYPSFQDVCNITDKKSKYIFKDMVNK